MTQPRAIPALVIMPFAAVTTEPSRLPDAIHMIGRLVPDACSPTILTLDLLTDHCTVDDGNRVVIDEDGIIVQHPSAAQVGKPAILQWQGFQRSHWDGSDTFYNAMILHAAAQVRAGRHGPYDARTLVESRSFANIPVAQAASRLEQLGDTRLKDFLAATYRQMATTRP